MHLYNGWNYGLKQQEVAELLGVTQTAVSKYASHCRGAIFEVTEVDGVEPIFKKTVFSLANGDMNKYELVEKLCMVCNVIRESGLMCILCEVSDPNIDNSQCIGCCPNGNQSKIHKSENE
ncbi:MAG: hypothetical protein P8X91_08750 [Candidatus Bathyarchaeota archaeon]